MGVALKVFTLDDEGNLTLGARVGVTKGKYSTFTVIGAYSAPIRVDVAKEGDLIFFAYLSEFSFPGEVNWEHAKVLVPLPGTMEEVEKMVAEAAIIVSPKETLLIRKGEVEFFEENDVAIFFQSGVKPTFH